MTLLRWGCDVAETPQVAGCYQIYCRPTYEPIEVKLMKHEQGPFSPYNVIMRLIITTTYIVIVSLLFQ